jgi:sugar/nucleoside kinase (ribokinase family)
LKDIASAANQLAKKSKLVVIKLGAEGALLQSGEKTIVSSSIPVKVVDTIGAGDSFDAGFLYGYLNPWDWEKSLRLATICGALSTQAAGGTNAQPTLEEALTYLK